MFHRILFLVVLTPPFLMFKGPLAIKREVKRPLHALYGLTQRYLSRWT